MGKSHLHLHLGRIIKASSSRITASLFQTTSIRARSNRSRSLTQSSQASSSSSPSSHQPKPLPPPSLLKPNRSTYYNARIRKAPISKEEIQLISELSDQISKLNSKRAQLSHKQNEIGSKIRELKSDKSKTISNQSHESGSKTEESEPESVVRNLQEESSDLRLQNRIISNQIQTFSDQVEELKHKIPNDTHPDSPIGEEENAKVIKIWSPSSSPSNLDLPSSSLLPITLKDFPSSPSASLEKDHQSTASSILSASTSSNSLSSLKISPLAFRQAQLTSGPGMLYLLPPISTLSNALIQFSLKTTLKKGFQTVSVPDLIKAEVSKRCGFEPRGESSQTFFVETERDRRKKDSLRKEKQESDADAKETEIESEGSDSHGNDLCLIGTAEIPLVSLLAGQTITSSDFSSSPIKLVSHSHAYRAEAGSRGKESKGLYRVHQFDKVEMVVICQGSTETNSFIEEMNSDSENQTERQNSFQSNIILEELREIQEEIVQKLGLTYRVLDMPTEELGASAYRKYDIEAWMPGRGAWGEISSASNCTDFQSRRLHIKHRTSNDSNTSTTSQTKSKPSKTQIEFVHTLNATAAAIPRLIVAILENHGLTEDNKKLRLPESLKPFWIGKDDEVEWFNVEAIESKSKIGHSETNSGGKRGFSTMIGNRKSSSSSAHAYLSSFTNRSYNNRLIFSSSNPLLKDKFSPISSTTRPYSSSSSSSSTTTTPETKTEKKPEADMKSKSTALSKAISSLRQLSERTGTDLASLIFSFLILHEITAFLPLIILFWLFNTFGVGISLLEWINGISSSSGNLFSNEEVNSKNQNEIKKTEGLQEEGNFIHQKIVGWINEGMKRAEKYGRRKGYFGFEKEDKIDKTATKDQFQSQEKNQDQGKERISNLDSSKLAGGLADAVAAYVS